jgi:WD40 repeat protein
LSSPVTHLDTDVGLVAREQQEREAEMNNPGTRIRKHLGWVGLIVPVLLLLGLHCPLAQGQNAKKKVDSDTVLAVAYSPDGRMLAGGGFEKAIRVWDARTGKTLFSLEGPKQTIRRSVAFSPDGKLLASSGDDGLILFWDLQTGKLERSLRGSPTTNLRFLSIVFSPDGNKMAAAGAVVDGEQRGTNEFSLLDLPTGKVKWTKGGYKSGNSLSYSPDGKTLAAANGEVQLFDVETGALIKTIIVKDRLTSTVAWSQDGKCLAGAGGYSIDVGGGGTMLISEAYLWDAQTGELLHRITDLSPWLVCIAYSPDGKIVATGGSGPKREKGPAIYVSSEIRLWDTQTGKLLRRIPGEYGGVSSMAFSPDGKSFLSCDSDVVVLTEVLTGLRRLELMKSANNWFLQGK